MGIKLASTASAAHRNGSADGASQTELPPKARPVHDLMNRNRDEHGNRLPWFFSYSVPTIQDVPLDETALANAIALICETRPIQGTALQHFFDDKLRPTLRRVQQVRDEEEARLRNSNAHATQTNREIKTRQAQIAQKRDSATAATRSSLEALDAPLHEAQKRAAEHVVEAGISYDPAEPSACTVLPEALKPLEVIAGEMQLPWTSGDASALMPAPVGWLATALIGTMIGLSLGIVAGFLHPDTLAREPFVIALCACIGLAVAVTTKYAARQVCQRASERYYLGKGLMNWLPIMMAAIALIATMVYMDALVEKEGLLKLARLHDSMQSLSGVRSSGAEDKEHVYLLIATILSLPYITYAGWEGYVIGRRPAVQNRLLARQAADFEAAVAARRELPEVKGALHAIADVNEVLRQQRELDSRGAAIAEPYNRDIATLETEKSPVSLELSVEAKRRYQDALDQMHATQEIFDAMFRQESAAAESSGGCLVRLWRKIWALRTPRSSGREHTHRLK